MPNSFQLMILLCSISFFCGCIEKLEQEQQSGLKSDLTGVWTIEHIHSNPSTREFINTYYNVYIDDNGEKVDINHCQKSENMYFVRDEEFLTNESDQKLRIVNGSVLNSINVPNVVQLKKTSKIHFLNAGTVTLNSGKFGEVHTEEGVCVQRTIKSSDQEGVYHFQLSFPFENSWMEMDLEYFKVGDSQTGEIEKNNIKSLSFSSPSFYRYYNSNSISTLIVHSELISVSGTSMRFDFDVTTEINRRFPGDVINGSIQVQY